jgi:hypothetical protein
LDTLPPQYGEFMTDPFTGLVIPKTLAGNLAWRKQLLQSANTSASMRRTIRTASASSPIYWLNAFGWTFLQKEVVAGKEQAVMGESSHIPFVTWKVQDDAMQDLYSAITQGNPVMIRKSRDMGASWIVVAMFQWFWQFRPSTTFLEISRKEGLVDRRGDMDSLFEKHRYLLRWQPEWMRPQRIKDNKLHLENMDIGSAIEGESTNESAGQASRKTAILLDEFARVANGSEIDMATADTSACRIFLSTPQGPNTAYAHIFRAMKSGVRDGKIIYLPWWRHPAKGENATQVADPITNLPKWTSPWYEGQIRLRSKKNVAMNLDMEDGAAGDLFFDAEEIEKHRQMYVHEPLLVGNIVFDEDMREDDKKRIIQKVDPKAMTFVQSGSRRPWRLWLPLVEDKAGQLRPNQNTRYVFGVDISSGSGASNSVISVLDHQTNMIVAKFWDAFTSPEQLVEIAAFGAAWFGGRKPPIMVFEKNGPGIIFGKKIVGMGYPGIYYEKIEDKRTRTPTRRWGWHSSTSKKEMLLGQYRDALKLNTIINPCEEALAEAQDYIYDDAGRLEPGHMTEEAGGGSQLHGDHVIADSLLVLGRQELPKTEPEESEARAPYGTYAHRRKLAKAKDRERDAWTN